MPLVQADYSQLELRLAGQVWPARKWLEDCHSGDQHQATVNRMNEEMMNHPRWPSLPEERRVLAKNANFGVVYQSMGRQIAEQTGQPLELVQAFIELQRETYAEFFSMIDATKAEVRMNGCLISITGRHRNFYLAHDAEKEIREAINWCVQGPAAELTWAVAQPMVDTWLRRCWPGTGMVPRIINNVHDSIMVDSPHECLNDVIVGLRVIMENLPTEQVFGWKLKVPLSVEIKVGPSWGELKEIKC